MIALSSIVSQPHSVIGHHSQPSTTVTILYDLTQRWTEARLFLPTFNNTQEISGMDANEPAHGPCNWWQQVLYKWERNHERNVLCARVRTLDWAELIERSEFYTMSW
jgi:hypothetical protein